MRLYLLSEKFFARPSDTEYLLQIIAAPSPEAAKACANWGVHGDSTVFVNWDIFDMGECNLSPRGLRTSTHLDQQCIEVASFDEREPILPDEVWDNINITGYEFKAEDGSLYYRENLDVVSNVAWYIPIQEPVEGLRWYALETNYSGKVTPTGLKLDFRIGGMVPREKTIFELIEKSLTEAGNAGEYPQLMQKIRDEFFSLKPRRGWNEIVEKHGDLEVTWWEDPTWRDELRGALTDMSMYCGDNACSFKLEL